MITTTTTTTQEQPAPVDPWAELEAKANAATEATIAETMRQFDELLASFLSA